MIKACLGLIKKDSGDVKILGKDIEDAKLSIAYVPQKDSVNWDFPISVYDVVMMVDYPYLKRFAKPSDKDKIHVEDALKKWV